MKILVVVIVVVLMVFTAEAQDRKVAVFEPAGNAESYIKDIVREEISAAIVNTVGYTVLERYLIDRVLAENKFQVSGLVDDAQISEMGRMMGANLALVATVTPMSSNFHISCKLIDVQTARIEKQQTTRTQNGMNDLMDVVRNIVGEMLGVTVAPSRQATNLRADEGDKSAITVEENNKLYLWGSSVLKTNPYASLGIDRTETFPTDGTWKSLTKEKRMEISSTKIFPNLVQPYHVRGIMQTNTEALRLYNKGMRQAYYSVPFWSIGIPGFVAGIIITGIGGYEEGLLMAGGSTGLMLVGRSFSRNSAKNIKKSVHLYNDGIINKTGFELKFGATGNGVGLALCF